MELQQKILVYTDNNEGRRKGVSADINDAIKASSLNSDPSKRDFEFVSVPVKDFRDRVGPLMHQAEKTQLTVLTPGDQVDNIKKHILGLKSYLQDSLEATISPLKGPNLTASVKKFFNSFVERFKNPQQSKTEILRISQPTKQAA